MNVLLTVLVVIALLGIIGLVLSLRIIQQYERGVLFRLGRVVGTREPGLTFIVPLIDRLRQVSLRIVTMPIQSQEIEAEVVDLSAVGGRRLQPGLRRPDPRCGEPERPARTQGNSDRRPRGVRGG